MVVDVQTTEDATGLLSFSFLAAAAATMAVVLVSSEIHHAVIADVVPSSGFSLSFAAVVAIAASKLSITLCRLSGTHFCVIS